MTLKDMLKNASEAGIDELDFFMETLERGFNLGDFKKIQLYEYAKQFMEEHGLV